MAKDGVKFTAQQVRDFYLYPSGSTGGNLARGCIWVISWFFGIVLQWGASQQALGSAYCIFALSLVMEFFFENRTYFWAKVIHDLFRILLLFMLFGAVLSIFWNILPQEVVSFLLCKILAGALPYVGGAVVFIIFLGTVLASLEVHKYFCDKDAILQREIKAGEEELRKIFEECLNGPRGGNA